MKNINNRTSPRRILNILEEIIVDPDNFTAKKISHKLKIPLPTIYRHIETLCEEKYLVSSNSKSYLPGPKMRNLILKSLNIEFSLKLAPLIMMKPSPWDQTPRLTSWRRGTWQIVMASFRLDFEKMTDSFLLRYQNLPRYFTPEMIHF